MAIFLTATQIYRMYQRELPEGVYPDGAASGSYSAASLYSKARLGETAYANLARIYDNYFPQTADEKQTDWETKVFGGTLDGALSLAVRRQKVIDKVRKKAGITKQDMIDIVQSVIGTNKDVAIGEWGNESGGWIIGESQLGVTTILSGARISAVTNFLYPGVDLCHLTAADVGMTQAEWLETRQDAYSYTVLIYSYTPTAGELAEINFLLSLGEPARSDHEIQSGLDPADHI